MQPLCQILTFSLIQTLSMEADFIHKQPWTWLSGLAWRSNTHIRRLIVVDRQGI